MECYLCGDDTNKSYFLRATEVKKDGYGFIIEVCPECHHYYKYGTEEQIKDYILKKRIDMRGISL